MLSVEHTTRLLQGASAGRAESRRELAEALYEELRALAGSYFRRQSADHTLQPTALVHEAWMRLAERTSLAARDREHFMAIAATAMRQVLVDHARARGALKRGGGAQRVELDALELGRSDDPARILAIDECLRRLAELDDRQAQVVEMRVFGQMSVEEVARVLDVSPRTVHTDWRMARAWLAGELGPATDDPPR